MFKETFTAAEFAKILIELNGITDSALNILKVIQVRPRSKDDLEALRVKIDSIKTLTLNVALQSNSNQ